MKKVLFFVFFAAAFGFLAACASTPAVMRTTLAEQEDLSGYWNSKDVKIVCDDLIGQCLSNSGVKEDFAKKGRFLRVIVGSFKNDSDEHLDTSIISSTMEVALDNSGVFRFVEGGQARDEIRAERQDQQYNSSEESAAALGNESAADYMLTGSVKSTVDRANNKINRSYLVRAELTSIETNERVWSGINTGINKTIVIPKSKL